MASLSNNNNTIKKKYSDLPTTPPQSSSSSHIRYDSALNDDNDDDNGDSYASLVMRKPTHSRIISADGPTTTTSMMSDNGGGGNHRRYNGNKNRNNNSAAAPAPPSRTLAGTLRGDGYGGGGGSGKRSSGRGGGGHGRRLTTSAAAAAAAADLIQSHNYEPDESEVWRAYVAHTHFQNRGQWWTTGKKRALKRWILTFLIGVMQALVAAMANFGAKTLAKYKFDHVYELLKTSSQRHNDAMSAASTDDLFQADALLTDDAYADSATNFSGGTSGGSSNEQSSSGPSGFGASAFLVYFLYQTFYVAMAALFVYIEPASGGSGIAEVKCFLNGIDLPRVVRVKTLFCKVIGVTFSVAAGLPIGMEGPMVHSGAAVAASISQGKTRLWGVLDTSFSKFSDFRNDREKRDFVACGVAAGVASAFGSPIGGVLFSLEEGASYWSTKLTWRAFFCAMTTLATLFWVRNIDTLWVRTTCWVLMALFKKWLPIS
jgi:Voltage gated chloride channel